MCIYLRGRYEITSNRESGLGRSDILLKALRPKDTHIIIEFKQGPDPTSLARAAIAQIEEMQYYAELRSDVLLLGIAHIGKACEIQSKELRI